MNNIVELFHQEIENFPEFFVEFYKQDIANKLITKINKFKQEFVTETEEEWIAFINNEKAQLAFSDKITYKCKGVDEAVL